MGNPTPILIPFLTLLFILHTNFLPATSTITTTSKDQIACTMCSACDNPCQPVPSLPPPPPSPPPPSPPPPESVSNCPPPPSPPSSGTYYYSPPPPPSPSQPTYVYSSPPPPDGVIGGAFYPPPNYGNYPVPPPPNPIVPYFPFYYYNPPPSSFISNSIYLKQHPIVSSTLIFLTFLYLF